MGKNGTEKHDKLTFREICRIEPRIRDLLQLARATQRIYGLTQDNGGMHLFYTEFKALVEDLAGWHADKPELKTVHCYDTVYHKISGAVQGLEKGEVLDRVPVGIIIDGGKRLSKKDHEYNVWRKRVVAEDRLPEGVTVDEDGTATMNMAGMFALGEMYEQEKAQAAVPA